MRIFLMGIFLMGLFLIRITTYFLIFAYMYDGLYGSLRVQFIAVGLQAVPQDSEYLARPFTGGLLHIASYHPEVFRPLSGIILTDESYVA
jgi:hypothetical protein